MDKVYLSKRIIHLQYINIYYVSDRLITIIIIFTDTVTINGQNQSIKEVKTEISSSNFPFKHKIKITQKYFGS